MKRLINGLGAAALVLAGLAGCGGDNGSGGSAPPPPPPTSLGPIITAAAGNPANDTSTNSSSAFTVLQAAGVPAVTVASPPKVNFTVFSDGAVKTGLTITNVSFAIAKLVPGTNGNIDQWQSYVYRTESTATAPNNVGSGPTARRCWRRATQATTDPKPATQRQLVYNADGYYTYTFRTDIKDPTKTNGVVFEPDRTHRVAIQLSYMNAAGETVLRQSVLRLHVRRQRQLGGRHRPDQDAQDDRRVVLQRLPREAGAARRRTRRHAVLRDVPQPRHDRRQQRQRADAVDDGAQDPRRAGC